MLRCEQQACELQTQDGMVPVVAILVLCASAAAKLLRPRLRSMSLHRNISNGAKAQISRIEDADTIYSCGRRQYLSIVLSMCVCSIALGVLSGSSRLHVPKGDVANNPRLPATSAIAGLTMRVHVVISRADRNSVLQASTNTAAGRCEVLCFVIDPLPNI